VPAVSAVVATSPLRVVVGEDNMLARAGIVHVLEQIEDVQLVGVATDLPSVLEAVERLRPDAVVTDIRMPPTATDEGIQLARTLRSSHPEVGVVVLSQHAEPVYALVLFEEGSGGRAYLLKERLTDPEELATALREVAAGGSRVDNRIVDQLLQQADGRSPLDRLTPRERELLALLAAGHSNRGIAEAMSITRRAVERHVSAIFAKLGLDGSEQVNRRVAATLMYLSSASRGGQ
jgi:DNA-binding NarL/FixJ family response regulator